MPGPFRSRTALAAPAQPSIEGAVASALAFSVSSRLTAGLTFSPTLRRS